MTDKDNAVIDALGRVNRFAIPRLADFEVGSMAITHFTRAGVIAAALTPSDSKPGLPASPATGARNHLFDEVWDDLLAIAETARTISRTEPGFSADFRLDGDTHQEIIATATAFLKKLQVPATAAKFIAYSMPADFVADLQTDLAAIDDKKSEQTDDRLDDIGDTAHNRALVKEARDLIKSLSTSVKNRYRRDSQNLAEWATASRIHRTGGGGPEETPPPAPPAP
ncbi:MAG: hypothetical protein RLZZ214_560 [Verrucomicrobiota bacterium]